jgi:hypothetical protein
MYFLFLFRKKVYICLVFLLQEGISAGNVVLLAIVFLLQEGMLFAEFCTVRVHSMDYNRSFGLPNEKTQILSRIMTDTLSILQCICSHEATKITYHDSYTVFFFACKKLRFLQQKRFNLSQQKQHEKKKQHREAMPTTTKTTMCSRNL